MNENSKNAIDLAYDGDIASMQSAIEDAIKDKIASAFEYKKQEIAQQLINNEEKCCDELSSKQKKEMDVDDDEDIDEKDLAALRKKKLNKESVEELQELSKNTLRKYIGKNVASTIHTNSDDIPKNRKKGLKTAYDKLNKESYIEEKLSVGDGVKAWIDDFIKSDDPRFEGKSKEERRKQAIAAFSSAKKGNVRNEEVEGLEEAKPSSGLSLKQKSSIVKKAKSGKNIGKKGKGFSKIEASAKKWGATDPKAVAASVMWKNIKRK